MVIRLFAAMLVGVWFASSAFAASIQTSWYGATPVISVVGELQLADGQNFADKIAGLSDGIVMLSSPGGNLLAGLRMGTIIRLKNFTTVVEDGTYCASACAFAWLGGTSRYMGEKGLVGFHAAYKVQNGRPAETGVGNALIGAYLSRLGLSDNAVVYITAAPPNAMNWLSISDAKALGINVTILPSAEAREPRPAPPPSPPIATASPRQNAPDATPTNRVSLEEVAKAFAATYFAHWSENNSDALRFFDQAYAETINFYDHPVARRSLMDEKRKYAARWPDRIYTTQPSTIKTSCDHRTGACTITGQVEWDCRDSDRGLRSVGLADFTLQIAMTDAGDVKVTGEWSSIVSKHD